MTKFSEINVLGKNFPNEKLCGFETPFIEALRPQEWSCQQQDRVGAILLGSADSCLFPHPCHEADSEWLRGACPKLEVWVSRISGAPLLQGQLSTADLANTPLVTKIQSFLAEIRAKYNLFQYLTLSKQIHVKHVEDNKT